MYVYLSLDAMPRVCLEWVYSLSCLALVRFLLVYVCVVNEKKKKDGKDIM